MGLEVFEEVAPAIRRHLFLEELKLAATLIAAKFGKLDPSRKDQLRSIEIDRERSGGGPAGLSGDAAKVDLGAVDLQSDQEGASLFERRDDLGEVTGELVSGRTLPDRWISQVRDHQECAFIP